jgi:succinyldiaminopimelate transaminase
MVDTGVSHTGVTGTGANDTGGFVPPEYPYDRLIPAARKAAAHDGGVVDLSIGTPTDPPPAVVLEALAQADERGGVRGYPPSIGSAALRQAIRSWTWARLGVELPDEAVAACVGTKEFVATLPQWLKLRSPSKDTILYPAVSYPTYEMGAILAGLRAVAVPVDDQWRLDLSAISDDDAARALALWINSPGNPAGGLDDLAAAAEWGRAHGVPVFSDECYVEFTWDGPPRTILSSGVDGVVAVNSLSKRSNLAGMRIGWYAGDPDLVDYLREVRKHVGMMVPGAAQAAGAAALADQDHVSLQRDRYWSRLVRMREILAAIGVSADLPGGGFYLWVPAPGGDAWAWTEQLAGSGGVLVSPGEFYGHGGEAYVRIAMVRPMEQLDLVAARLGV